MVIISGCYKSQIIMLNALDVLRAIVSYISIKLQEKQKMEQTSEVL